MKGILILALLCVSLLGNYVTASASDYALTISVWMENRHRIATIGEDGSNLTFLTDPNSSNSQGVWSPDGRQIAFTSDRDGNSEIYVMDANGENPRQVTVTNSPFWNCCPS